MQLNSIQTALQLCIMGRKNPSKTFSAKKSTENVQKAALYMLTNNMNLCYDKKERKWAIWHRTYRE